METGTGGDFGQAIIPGLDESTGSLVPMRADPRGGLSIAAMPDGIKYAPDALAGARAGGTIDGKTMANARAALPGAEQTVQITLDAVDTLRNDKQGQAEMFNGFNRYFGSTKGTPMANFEVNLNQASGQAFMQARQMLKGGGQITDFDGRRAEAAFSRLSDAASQGDLPTFLAALDDFEMAVTEGYRKLQAVANGTYQPTTSLPGGGSGSADPLNLFGGSNGDCPGSDGARCPTRWVGDGCGSGRSCCCTWRRRVAVPRQVQGGTSRLCQCR
ncbi:MAG: hypothetical protein IPK28_15075 [Devosia sp.]|nr:hypothetical protein [Devosia sp.]